MYSGSMKQGTRVYPLIGESLICPLLPSLSQGSPESAGAVVFVNLYLIIVLPFCLLDLIIETVEKVRDDN